MTVSAVILASYLVVTFFGFWLSWLNIRHLRRHGGTVPPEFQDAVAADVLRTTAAYTLERTRVGIIESIFDAGLVVLFFFGGLGAAYDRFITGLTDSFLGGGVLFILGLTAARTLLDIPFSLYRNFGIEQRYGFNRMTLRLWTADLAKSLLVSAVIGAIAVSAALAIIQASPERWWLWVWAFFLVFSLFLMYLAPYLIEPLFFKFEPIRIEGLEQKIRSLLERAGLSVSRVFQVDASRRSGHSNAYFTGIGRVKRIVLFDTLLRQMREPEVLAVLAHEAGHWKRRHILRKIVLTEVLALAGLYGAHHLLRWEGLPGLLGLPEASFYLRITIIAFLASLVLFPLTPVFSALSRRDERQADRFAVALTNDPDSLASALVKLSTENLANLHPHPLYAAFYYSHPPMVERVRKLLGSRVDGRGIGRDPNVATEGNAA